MIRLVTIPKRGKVFYLEAVYPGNPNITYAVTGRTALMHNTGCGKAMLSEMSEEAVNLIIKAHGLQRFTSTTITTSEELKKDLENIRECGFAVDRCEHLPGVKCVGVSVKGKGGLLGSLSIASSPMNLPDSKINDYAAMLLHAAMLLSSKEEYFPYCEQLPQAE